MMVNAETSSGTGSKSMRNVFRKKRNVMEDDKLRRKHMADQNAKESLVNVTIPPTVTKIQDEEFMDCVNLVSVILPESLKEIGEDAFLGCEKLQKINLPPGLTYIAPRAFFECVSLPDPEIPEGIKTIERETFVECEFKGIKLPKTLEKIDESAFWLCNKLETIEIPDNVTEIANHAFDSCEELESITLPEGLKSISFGAFSDCKKLSAIKFPKGLLSIGEDAFSGCESLKTVELPPNIKSIGAFYNCTSLERVVVPNEVTEFGHSAFRSCINLTEINFPKKLTSIGDLAFEQCIGLTEIKLPDGLESIGYAAFHLCTNLTNITIPDSVTSIGDSAFEECTNLTSVTIPASVTKLGKGAFRDCPNLKDIYISKDSPLAERLKAVAPKGITVHLTDSKSEMLRELKAAISNGKDNVRGGLEEMYRKGSLQSVLPELAALRGLEQGGYHTEGDAYEHTILAVEHLPADVDNVTVLAALFHDLGKGGVHSDGTTVRQIKPDTNGDSPEYTFYGHPSVSAKMVDAISERLNLPPRTHAILRVSAEMHMNWDMTPAKVRKTILDTMTDCGVPENERQKVFERALNTLANVMNADSLATKGNPKKRNDAFTILADARKISKDELVVKGKELADMAGTDVRRSSLVTQMVQDAINKGLPNTKESLKAYLETDATRKDLNKRIQEYDSKSKTR